MKTYRDVPLVKILAGIRRCGKSTILDMLRNDLLESGITADHIITMRYTSEDFDDGVTDKDMYNGIKEHMTGEGRYYLLLDEVQEINGWEKGFFNGFFLLLFENFIVQYPCVEKLPRQHDIFI